MSQEKVSYKKEQKQNRKKIVHKKKVEYVLSMVCLSIVCVAVVAWIGYSIYTKASAYAAENVTYEYNEVSTDALQEYISGINE